MACLSFSKANTVASHLNLCDDALHKIAVQVHLMTLEN